MYRIAVLTSSETQEAFYIEQLSRFCFERGLFPKMDCYRGQELFFDVARVNAPTCTVIALPGVEGLNAVEQGLSTWLDGKKASALSRVNHNKHNNEEDY